jgi:hypothetical protein
VIEQSQVESKNPFRCFNTVFVRNAILIALAVVLLALLGRRFPLGSPTRIAIGALQAVLMAGVVIYAVAAIRSLDEFLQRLHLESIAIAFAVSGALITGYGMLEHAGLPRLQWSLWAWPLMALLWALGVAVRGRHYR